MSASQPFGLYVAWLLSIIATLGSLYFSEVRNFVPCPLCWYQRILMYPLVIILGIASFYGDHRIVRYALPLSVLGAGTALYHYLIQKVPALAPPALCQVGVPCTAQYINWFGFITIPFLALVAFTLISIVLTVVARQNRHVDEAEEAEEDETQRVTLGREHA